MSTEHPLSMTDSSHSKWEAVIGLEVHIQLKTSSKLFSGAATAFGAAPNTQACIVDLGLPGVLPVLNQTVINMAIRFALSINADISPQSFFARKNYFYPDLPKGYQISQYDQPILCNGFLLIKQNNHPTQTVPIVRAHLEEDAGKSLHDQFQNATAIDLNRAGIALLEIVTAPVLHSAKEAIAYLKALHTLVCYLEICDGNLQEGSFRCDTNISIRPYGTETLGTRTELKNMNSFRFIELATNYEINRQIALLEQGQPIQQETRLYDAKQNRTRPMRNKENAHDYRYFPDPDLLPITITSAQIDKIRATLPELPQQKYDRFMTQYGLDPYDAHWLVQEKETAYYYENTVNQAVACSKQHSDPTDLKKVYKLTANWIGSELFRELKKSGLAIQSSPIDAKQLGQLIAYIAKGHLSGKNAKQIFALLLTERDASVEAMIKKYNFKQVHNQTQIEHCIDAVLQAHPEKIMDYRAGKEKLLGYFIGLAMKASNGQLDPVQLNALLKEKLQG